MVCGGERTFFSLKVILIPEEQFYERFGRKKNRDLLALDGVSV